MYCKEKCNQETWIPVIGQVYYMKFRSCVHGQHVWRPGVICQNNVGNIYSPNIIAIPLTTVIKKTEMPTHVVLDHPECGLKLSMALCENLHYLSKEDVGDYITTLPEETMYRVAKASLMATALVAYIPAEELEQVRESAIKLNAAERPDGGMME